MTQTPEQQENLLNLLKFPSGIKCCDWLKLSTQEIDQLWINYLINKLNKGLNMLSNTQLEEKLSTSPAPRVTSEQMQSRIKTVSYYKIGNTVTLCNIELDNDYSVRGESACVNLINYDKEIGEKIAYENAFGKLWALFGFLLAEDNFHAKRKEEFNPEV